MLWLLESNIMIYEYNDWFHSNARYMMLALVSFLGTMPGYQMFKAM